MTKAVDIVARTTLAQGKGLLERLRLRHTRYDGGVQEVDREVYSTGDAAAILLYDTDRKTIVLLRQTRAAAFANGGERELVEVPAGKLEGMDPAQRIVKEVLEETGFHVGTPREVFVGYMSPSVFTEKLTFFVAPYTAADRKSEGGGLKNEGEDIHVFEVPLTEALAMIERREIIDIKTIALIYYAALHDVLNAA